MLPDADFPCPAAAADETGPPVPGWLLAYDEALRRGDRIEREAWLRKLPENQRDLRVLDRLYAAARSVADDSRVDAQATIDDTAAPSWELPVGKQLGVYRLVRAIGRGGMGRVYEAEDENLGRRVALKTLSAGQAGAEAMQRFRRERKSLGQLRHRNIVDAFYADTADGVDYLVMEIVDGKDLADLVRTRGPLAIADGCWVAQQVAEALQYAHERGIIHRDVKPSNLMLTSDGTVKVLDFGLARPITQDADEVTHAGQAVGTVDYMAPEQWEHSRNVDARADQYSLGCTLHFLLAGHAPFSDIHGRDYEQKRLAHAGREPPPIAGLPAALGAVLQRLLAKKAEDRYASASDVVAALIPFTAGNDLPKLLCASDVPTAAYIPTPSVPLSGSAASPSPGIPPAWKHMVRLGLAALVVFGGGIAVWWPRGDRPTGSQSNPPDSLQTLPPVAEHPEAVGISWQLDHYRRDSVSGQFTSLPVMLSGASVVRHRDAMRVKARFSQPAHAYLIALNPDGSVQLLHPEGEPGPPGLEFVHPGDPKETPELDQIGFQAFVLVASRQPLPPFAQWQPRINIEAWKQAAPAVPWQFDGRNLELLPGGQRTGKVAVGPQPLAEVCRQLQAVEGVAGVQAIGFSVLRRE